MTDYEVLSLTGNSRLLKELEKDADEAMESVLAGRLDPVPELSDDAKQALRDNYLQQVQVLYINALLKKILAKVMPVDPEAGLNPNRLTEELFRQAEDELAAEMGPNPVDHLREEFPVIPEMEKRIRDNYIAAQTEMLDQVSRHRAAVSARLFGGREITRINALTGMQGDVHRRGRAVAGVKTDAGTFYYKPHDCSLDQLYSKLVSRFFADCTVAADCVPGDGCGFVSELVRSPLESAEAVHDYYRNFGMLTALFSSIGTTDMHHENLLPCGNRPAAVDLETLFRPGAPIRLPEGDVSDVKLSVGTEFSLSALTTSVLPHYIRGVGCLSPLYAIPGSKDHLPYFGDRVFPVSGCEDDFLEGFSLGYRRVLENREAITELLLSCHGAPVRYVLRNTAYYGKMQMQIFRGRYLVSREKQQEILDRLQVTYKLRGNKINEPVVRYEAACLKEGDIPYFCIPFDGRNLCGGSTEEVIVPDYLAQSIRDRITAVLRLMSDKNGRFEADLIRAVLSQAPCMAPADRTEEPFPDSPVTEGQITALAEEISRQIAGAALHTSLGPVVWYSQVDRMFSLESWGYRAAAAAVGLYQALLVSAGLPADPEIIRQSMETLEYFLSALEQTPPPLFRNKTPFGYDCLAVFPEALDRLASVSAEGAEAAFGRFICLLLDKGPEQAEKPEALPAMAELLMAVCRSRTPHPRKSEWVRKAAEKLAAKPLPPKAKAAEKASVAAALALSAEKLEEDSLREAAAGIFGNLRNSYRQELNGWPDETQRFIWNAPRGSQAPWIGLCALMAVRSGCESARELLDLSLTSLMGEETLRYNDSLYHGNALSALFLSEAARNLENPRFADRAGRILAAMARRKERKGAFTVFPEGARSAFDPAFSRGTVGIGAALLNRLAPLL